MTKPPNLHDEFDAYKKRRLLEELEKNEWNVLQTARLTGVNVATLNEWIRRHGLKRPTPSKHWAYGNKKRLPKGVDRIPSS
jgi:transcriptional regulator with GAF, ATPase, and Fis domain